MAEHRVALVQFLGAAHHGGGVEAGGRRRRDVLLGVRQELVQRRVEQADGDRQAVHDRNSSTKSPAASAGSWPAPARRPSSSSARIISRTAAMRSASKNMCSVRHRPMPSAPNRARCGVERGLGVGADLQAAHAVGPFHQLAKSPDSSGSIIFTAPARISPVEPSMVMTSPAGTCGRARGNSPSAAVDLDFAGAGDAGPAHAAGDHRRVAGHAAARGEDAAGRVHAVDVLGLVSSRTRITLRRKRRDLGLVGVNTTLPVAAPGEAGRPAAITSRGARVDGRVQQLVERGRLDARDGLLRVIRPSAAMSTAIFSAALAVRFPLRVCSM
jgi:hypothetical protein